MGDGKEVPCSSANAIESASRYVEFECTEYEPDKEIEERLALVQSLNVGEVKAKPKNAWGANGTRSTAL